MTFGQHIKELRVKKGLSQRELGARMNVSQQMIGQYESSDAIPKIDTLKKIANALGVDTIELLNYVGAFLERDTDMDPDGNVLFLDWGQDGIDYLRNCCIQDDEQELINKFRCLNNTGKQKAVEQVNILSRVPEYQKDSEES